MQLPIRRIGDHPYRRKLTFTRKQIHEEKSGAVVQASYFFSIPCAYQRMMCEKGDFL
jgi:hypothetical protein